MFRSTFLLSHLFVLGLFIALLNFQISFGQAEPSEFSCIGSGQPYETADCFISFLQHSRGKFVVKQIKDPSPDEQFLLVLDASGCHIAETSHISVNQVMIIPPTRVFPGKKIPELPATLHTMAMGVSTDQGCDYQDVDIHQRFRKENSAMWHEWGALAPEKTSLTLAIIQHMTRHSDLPPIVALDTFLGNADRSAPNLFYDLVTDHFCGIDMGGSFCSPLAYEAYRQLRDLKKTVLTQEEKLALIHYVHT